VGIDAPDFNLGLEKALRRSGIPTLHYVSPSIWVWRSGRIKTVREAADCVLCILPFEKAIYERHGIEAVFVGHPKADSLPATVDTGAARRRLGLGDGPVVAVLPGSRGSEVSRLAPYFAAAAAIIARAVDGVKFVTPIASQRLRPVFEAEIEDKGIADRFTLRDGESIDVMSAADVVLLASGTAALESALLQKPTVAAYKISWLSAILVRLIGVKTRYFTLPNLVANEALVPEIIQEAVTPEALADAVVPLLEDAPRRAALSRRFATLRSELALGADQRAADAVIKLAT
jgi:lipid-A-disaccharide synthase